jgi:glycosyltransferase involved in cell wall biosynthesis
LLDRITPLILTRDEAANIGRTLAQLSWAREVIVLDSMSGDATVEIARRFPNVRIVQRTFDSHAAQWAFGVAHVSSEWVLTLDADYFVTDAAVREIAALDPPPDVAAYIVRFVYAIGGRPLRAALYPPRAVLLRSGRFEFFQDGHTQRTHVDGGNAVLREPFIHDDRKSWESFVARQQRYAREEAAKLKRTRFGALNFASKLRKLRIVAPAAVVVQTLLLKGLILEGRDGLRYAKERFVAEAMLSRELWR